MSACLDCGGTECICKATAQIKALEADSRRYHWILPILAVIDDETLIPERRVMALGAALLAGLKGEAAIDKAMEICP